MGDDTGPPLGIGVAANEEVFVSHRKVQKFASDGSFLSSLGGGLNGEFAEASDVAVDPQGNLYVIDSIRRHVRKYVDLTTPARAAT